MRKLFRASAALAITITLKASSAYAVPLTTMLQGYLTTSDGTPFTTPQMVEFRVFHGGQPGTAGSGALVYAETATVSPSPAGVFTYLLGSGTPTQQFLVVNGQAQANVLSTTTYDTSQVLYVELGINGTTLLPRIQLAGVPYSVVAAFAENLKPGSQVNTTGLNASWVRVFSTDTSTPSVVLSTSMKVEAGGVYAPFFAGKFHGDGSELSNVTASSVSAASVLAGRLAPGVLLPVAQLTDGPISGSLLPTGIAYTGAQNQFTAPQTINAGGGSQPSLALSSGITVGAGGVTAPYLSGLHLGDGSRLTGISASRVPASGVEPGRLPDGVRLPASGLSEGPISAAMLPSTAAYTSVANNFTAPQTISAPAGLTVNNAISAGSLSVAGAASAQSFTGNHVGDGSGLTNVPASVRYLSGSSPSCGSGSTILKNYAVKQGVGSPCCSGIMSCNTPAGWALAPPSCQTHLFGGGSCPSGCYVATWTADTWTASLCGGQ